MSQLNGAPPPFFSAGEKVFVNRARSVFGIFLGTREKRRVGGGRLVVTKPPHSRSSETDFVFACRPLALAFFRPHLRPCDSSVQTDSLQPAASSQPSQQHIRPDFPAPYEQAQRQDPPRGFGAFLQYIRLASTAFQRSIEMQTDGTTFTAKHIQQWNPGLGAPTATVQIIG